MSSHGCILCSKCRGICAPCGTCSCHRKEPVSWRSIINVDLTKKSGTELIDPTLVDQDEEQKPETD